MSKKPIVTANAPQAIGPYSQAIHAGEWVFCSGQVAIDPATGTLIKGGVADETARVLDNLKAVLTEAGSSLDQVVKTTVYLADLGDFAVMNGVYAEYFGADPPARATVEVAALPIGARVEIDAVAQVDGFQVDRIQVDRIQADGDRS